ncbi:MAG: hypothetical protein J7M01_00770 [Candidatus Marinimicrobia bacterium]|nr:hypothetical protein [Candidatus Neomarinimicrobiota bacterium]
MKKSLVVLAVFLVSSYLMAGEFKWRTMAELAEKIEFIKKSIYIYFCFNNDYFSQLYNEKVMTDERVIKILSQNYYSVRFYARENTNAYTI